MLFGEKRHQKPFTLPSSKLYFDGGCVKSFFTALRAELYFVRHIIFTISRSEIVKMMCLTKKCFAAEGGKSLFTQPCVLFEVVIVF